MKQSGRAMLYNRRRVALPSITSIDSFRHRAQRSEQWRTVIMLGVLAIQLIVVVARRATGGEIMANNSLFFPALAIVLALTVYEVVMLATIRRAIAADRLLPNITWPVSAAIELAMPLTMLTLYQLLLTADHARNVNAPVMLTIPIIMVLSILRLRPRYPLVMGVVAALIHLGLTRRALRLDAVPADVYPMMLTYPVMLLIIGLCAAMVAREARRHVREAIDETLAGEVARHRVQSMEHDLGVARDIQRGLIPTNPPRLAGFDIAGMNRPADLTGGDYYDWQTLPDGRVMFVMADVTGHGIGPALVMAICRAYARAVGPVLPNLTDLLQRLNSLIHDDVQGHRFITLVVAMIDPRTSRMELLSAGHGPTLLYRAASKSIERFDGDGIPLGIIADEQYAPSRHMTLEPGDTLLMMTDGYFEWARPSDNQQFGIERIADLLKQNASLDAASLLRRMDDAVRRFTEGARQSDDMTAVAVRRV